MASIDPFESTIFRGDPRVAPAGDAAIYPAERERLAEVITRSETSELGSPGNIQLIRGHAAGTGKSHLLAAALSGAAGRHRVLPLVFNRETPPSWVELFKQSLILLADRPPGAALSPLSETSRRLLAELVGDLIDSGLVPAENPGRARRALENNPVKLFDLRGGAPIASWFLDNADALLDPLAARLQKRTRMGLGECRNWLSFLIDFETGLGEVPVPETFAAGEGLAKAQMRHLGQLVSRYRPLLLVFDQLDAFYGDADSALTLAYLFSEVARIGVAPLTLVAINDDLWSETFAPALPGALADRMTEGCIELRGIGLEEAEELVRSRLRNAGAGKADEERLWGALALDQIFDAHAGNPIPPRQLLRIAGDAWRNGTTRVAPDDAPATGDFVIDHPAAAPARETLGRVQAMLREFNQRRPSPGRPGTVEPAAEPTAHARERSPWPQPPSDAPRAVREFASQRDAIYFGSDLVFDPSAIRHALELAGRRSPLIDYQEFHVAGGTDAACWRSPDHEILFGFEPAERTPYWRALVEQAGESPVGRAKVVAFTPPGASGFESEGLNGHADGRLDVLELDRRALATIAATDRVVGAADDQEATFALLAPELDSLWRRITRPMGA